MTSISDGEGGLSVRTKLNASLAVTDAFSVSSGNVGIGTTSPTSNLHVYNANAAISMNEVAAAGTGVASTRWKYGTNQFGLYVGPTNALIAYDYGAAAERMRINASGSLLVGTTAAPAAASTYGGFGGELSVVGSASNSTLFYTTGSINSGVPITGARGNAGPIAYWFHNGSAVGNISVTSSATSYATSSDYRLKENVAPMQNALDTVAQLNPVTYTWKADGSAGQGFIAHELQAVVPDCVTGEKDAVDAEGNPQYQGVDTSFLVGILTKAIQEQQAMIAALQARLTAANL